MTVTRQIFHLAFPVENLEASRAFYVETLGAAVGRSNEEWLDIVLWGHQITLHARPSEVPSRRDRGVRHFGVILPWLEWERTAQQIEKKGVPFMSQPAVSFAGTPKEQAKFYMEDPSGNVIEIKAYRDLNATLELKDEKHWLVPA